MSKPTSAAAEDDGLFELPLDDFTGARNDLARKLVKENRRTLAEQVKQLKKPKPSAWAVNQLARKHGTQLKVLFVASDALKDPSQFAHGDKIRSKASDFRDTLKALQSQARSLLEDAGNAASDRTLTEVMDTLRGACADPGLREQVLEGRLTEPLQGDFGFLMSSHGPPSDLPEPRGPARTHPKEDMEKQAQEKAALTRKRTLLEQKVHRLKKDLSLAQSRVDSAQRQLQDVQALYEKAVDALQAFTGSPGSD